MFVQPAASFFVLSFPLRFCVSDNWLPIGGINQPICLCKKSSESSIIFVSLHCFAYPNITVNLETGVSFGKSVWPSIETCPFQVLAIGFSCLCHFAYEVQKWLRFPIKLLLIHDCMIRSYCWSIFSQFSQLFVAPWLFPEV